VQSDSTEHILNDFAGITGFAIDERKGGLDASSKCLIRESQHNLLLLAGFREVHLQEGD
jgi:hypothetical protein